jgi:ribonuclease-3
VIKSVDIEKFEKRLGYAFKDPKYLFEALTHPSFSSTNRSDNQRLEFIGDRVLGLVVAEAIAKQDPNASEGKLAPRFNALVRKEACSGVAQEIDLGLVLKLGRSEMITGGRRKNAVLGDAMEAVLAAIYLDGGFQAAKDIILQLWEKRISSVELDARDSKTRLQEWAQARRLEPPVYTLIDRTGPDHSPIFNIEVELKTGEKVSAQAGNKRDAEQNAAKMLLKILKDNQ